MAFQIFHVPHKASFRWKWRDTADDGRVLDESDQTYELFYECVCAARKEGYDPKIKCR